MESKRSEAQSRICCHSYAALTARSGPQWWPVPSRVPFEHVSRPSAYPFHPSSCLHGENCTLYLVDMQLSKTSVRFWAVFNPRSFTSMISGGCLTPFVQ